MGHSAQLAAYLNEKGIFDFISQFVTYFHHRKSMGHRWSEVKEHTLPEWFIRHDTNAWNLLGEITKPIEWGPILVGRSKATLLVVFYKCLTD